ncbi:uncharacterized protein PV09_03315 [Verruconis gallopava]|uniref:Rhodopsin domain-containing protein n=1 Tax=Verruconis gallopava TaxID=253628 RepID=A0A0D2AGV9_9PEZI|nr:uncharacterized protein PV09_03315 [Verruconis gallopava]KIW06153.1 hypothetical protein PV09_03315 [Verruconis gallopava]
MAGGIHPPPEVIAEWAAKANYVNPETRGGGIVAMEIVLLIACFLVVALRIYTRIFQSRTYGWDDTVIIFNLIPLTGMAVSLCLALSKYGWNRHAWDIPLDMLYSARKVGFCVQIFYLLSTVATKISILLFYRRLTSRVSTAYLWVIYGSIAFVASFAMAGVITMFVGCRPLSAYWLQVNPLWFSANQGKFFCYNEGVYIVIAASISMVTDFVVCVLPLCLFLKIQIHWKQKLALTAIFGVGFFLCICGILRMVKIVRTYYGTFDITWSSEPVWVWTGIEAHMAVVLASLPALNHFVRKSWNDSSLSSRLRYFTDRHGSRFSSGYKRTQSKSNSEWDGNTQRELANDKQGIHVVQEVHLEEFLRDKSYDDRSGGRNGVNIDEEAMKKDRRAWLDETTSDDDSIRRHRLK